MVAGVADDAGFGFAIAKALGEAGASVSVATWPPALNIFMNLLERGKMDESRRLSSGELLSFDEIVRVVRVGAGLGLGRVRLTGGEPLVRPQIDQLVARIAAVEGVHELTLTTNAALLDRYARKLAAAAGIIPCKCGSARVADVVQIVQLCPSPATNIFGVETKTCPRIDHAGDVEAIAGRASVW